MPGVLTVGVAAPENSIKPLFEPHIKEKTLHTVGGSVDLAGGGLFEPA
jgi:hypothetical protein